MMTNESVVEPVTTSALRRLKALLQSSTGPGAVLYMSTMLSNVLGYVFFFVMARVLNVAEYGEIVTLTGLVYIFTVVTRSLQAWAAQAVANFRGSDLELESAGYLVLRQVMGPVLIGASLIIGLAWLISAPVASLLRLSSAWPMLLLGAYVATQCLLSVPRGLLLGAGRLYYASWVSVVEPVIRLAVALIFVTSPLRLNGALLSYSVGLSAASALAVLPFVRARRVSRHLEAPRRPWLMFDQQFAFALTVNAALMILASIDPLAIRRFFSATVSGTYAAAFLLGRIILLNTISISWVVFSRAVLQGGHDLQVKRVLQRGLLSGGAVAGLAALLYWLAPGFATVAIGGPAYKVGGNFIGLVGLEMIVFTFVSIQAFYHIAIRNTSVLPPFLLALLLEAALLATFHAAPITIVFDTLIALTALLVWVSALTIQALRPEKSLPRLGANSLRACMVVFSHYPGDPRVRREAEALLQDNWDVDVICLPDEGQAKYEVVSGARVYRIPLVRQRNASQITYLLEYGTFLMAAAIKSGWLHMQRRYQVVQVHNMPDFLVFAALIPKILGARVVLDVHDLVPEFYRLRFGLSAGHPLIRVARWIQKQSARFAHHVITAGEPFRRQIASAGIAGDKITSIMNSPDPRLFWARPFRIRQPRDSRRFVLCYHGTLSEYNDLGLVLQAIAELGERVPQLEFRVFGRGRTLPMLQAMVSDLKLENQVKFYGYRALDEMPDLIAEADLGIVPQRKSAFTALNYPTKAFEYIALGIPVCMSWTPALAELFGDFPGIFFQPDNVAELARLIEQIALDPALARATVGRQQAACAGLAWVAEKLRYLAVMKGLAMPGSQLLEPVQGLKAAQSR
jgi:glycosyltransferase involved in cell wall biosynthesis/O-antigen/teichoic acid export membrane protein